MSYLQHKYLGLFFFFHNGAEFSKMFNYINLKPDASLSLPVKLGEECKQELTSLNRNKLYKNYTYLQK